MFTDRALLLILGVVALVVGSLLVVVTLFIGLEGADLIGRHGLGALLFGSEWDPYSESFGVAPMLAASVVLMFGAVFVAGPFAVIVALFVNYYAPPVLAGAARRLVEVVAGVPSVVYGLWGLTVLVPLISRWQQPGTSLLAGILILAVMIFPTMLIIIDSALKELPDYFHENAAALALRRHAVAFSIALPAIRGSLSTAGTLGAARAIGETMAVMMVCGNLVQIPGNLFAPVRALTSNIALEMAYALGDHRAALYVSSLALLSVVVALVLLNQRVVSRVASHA